MEGVEENLHNTSTRRGPHNKHASSPSLQSQTGKSNSHEQFSESWPHFHDESPKSHHDDGGNNLQDVLDSCLHSAHYSNIDVDATDLNGDLLEE